MTSFDTFLTERERASTAFVDGDAGPLLALSVDTDPATIYPPTGALVADPTQCRDPLDRRPGRHQAGDGGGASGPAQRRRPSVPSSLAAGPGIPLPASRLPQRLRGPACRPARTDRLS